MDIETILKEFTSMMKESSLQAQKTFKSEKSSGKLDNPDAETKKKAFTQEKNFSIAMQPAEKKKQSDLVAEEEKMTG